MSDLSTPDFGGDQGTGFSAGPAGGPLLAILGGLGRGYLANRQMQMQQASMMLQRQHQMALDQSLIDNRNATQQYHLARLAQMNGGKTPPPNPTAIYQTGVASLTKGLSDGSLSPDQAQSIADGTSSLLDTLSPAHGKAFRTVAQGIIAGAQTPAQKNFPQAQKTVLATAQGLVPVPGPADDPNDPAVQNAAGLGQIAAGESLAAAGLAGSRGQNPGLYAPVGVTTDRFGRPQQSVPAPYTVPPIASLLTANRTIPGGVGGPSTSAPFGPQMPPTAAGSATGNVPPPQAGSLGLRPMAVVQKAPAVTPDLAAPYANYVPSTPLPPLESNVKAAAQTQKINAQTDEVAPLADSLITHRAAGDAATTLNSQTNQQRQQSTANYQQGMLAARNMHEQTYATKSAINGVGKGVKGALTPDQAYAALTTLEQKKASLQASIIRYSKTVDASTPLTNEQREAIQAAKDAWNQADARQDDIAQRYGFHRSFENGQLSPYRRDTAQNPGPSSASSQGAGQGSGKSDWQQPGMPKDITYNPGVAGSLPLPGAGMGNVAPSPFSSPTTLLPQNAPQNTPTPRPAPAPSARGKSGGGGGSSHPTMIKVNGKPLFIHR